MNINPFAVTLIAWATVIGAIFGHTLIGLFIGLTIVVLASLAAMD